MFYKSFEYSARLLHILALHVASLSFASAPGSSSRFGFVISVTALKSTNTTWLRLTNGLTFDSTVFPQQQGFTCVSVYLCECKSCGRINVDVVL